MSADNLDAATAKLDSATANLDAATAIDSYTDVTPVNVTPVTVTNLGAADPDPTDHHRTRPSPRTAHDFFRAANSGSPPGRAE